VTDPHRVVESVIHAVNAHDPGALRGLYSREARTRRPGWPQEGGLEELLASYEMDFACVPDLRFAPLATLSDGPNVATEIRITGPIRATTVLGDFGKALLGRDVETVPPTGRPIDLPAALVHEIRDAHAVAERQYWDCSSSSFRRVSSAVERTPRCPINRAAVRDRGLGGACTGWGRLSTIACMRHSDAADPLGWRAAIALMRLVALQLP
jgi:SnoaL-like domain